MPRCFFVSDLHGNTTRYRKLFDRIREEQPEAVFFGGDILPTGLYSFTKQKMLPEKFINGFLRELFEELKERMTRNYPLCFLILGNDDGKVYEPFIQDLEAGGFLHYVHFRKVQFKEFQVFGYSCVPPTPFSMKDWEKYDVSRYVDPGCIAPEEGSFTVEVNKKRLTYETIQKDLAELTAEDDLSKAIFLFHTPPYKTHLDRAALDGKFYDHVPLDVHVGSIAVKKLIEERQPLITLHGHIHESTSITGHWQQRIGNTLAMNAAHDHPQLSLIRFDPEKPEESSRELI